MDNFFSLPFSAGTRKLSLQTLDNHSDFRKPQRGYMPVTVKESTFVNELLTLRVILEKEPEEKVYLKVTEHALLVSCSVDTDESYLSRYAYFAIRNLISYRHEYDFEDYYWPGLFNAQTGRSRFLTIAKMRDKLICHLKIRYIGMFKPGQQFPLLSDADACPARVIHVPVEAAPKNDDPVLGFCLADTHSIDWHSNHWPFLVPYLGVLDRTKTFMKGFSTYVLSGKAPLLSNLSDEQQKLVEICFEMKENALIDFVSPRLEANVFEERRENNKSRSRKLFALWQEAMPILTGRLYTHYHFSYGMRNIKGKPSKQKMHPCTFSTEVPELCFVWKEYEDHYKLDLRFRLGKKVWMPSYEFNSKFFANTAKEPRKYYLLNSFMDCQLVTYFQKNKFQLLVMKEHYQGDCKDFVDQLRKRYRFINDPNIG